MAFKTRDTRLDKDKKVEFTKSKKYPVGSS